MWSVLQIRNKVLFSSTEGRIRQISKRQYPAGMVWWMIHKQLTRSREELLIILMPLVKNVHCAPGDVNLCPERKKGEWKADIKYRDDWNILISKDAQIALWPHVATKALNMPALRDKTKENIPNRTTGSCCKLSPKPVKWIRIWPYSACLVKWRFAEGNSQWWRLRKGILQTVHLSNHKK